MKRAEQLVPLSHDHHQGLVVSQHALRLTENATSTEIEQHWLKVKDCLIEQAQHHFVIEEQYLLEPLAKLGGNDEMWNVFMQTTKPFVCLPSTQLGRA